MATKNSKKSRKLNVVTSENDNVSDALADLVPDEHKGTDRFLDVVQWNIEWFGAGKSRQKDKVRRAVVMQILEALNADLFIFQEVVGPSRDRTSPGVLDSIATDLERKGAGDYHVEYTNAGGEQRVAMMWDRDFLRSHVDVTDLFPRGTHLMPDGKDAFALRTPLYAYFSAKLPQGAGGGDAFDFQVLGVHLKAMGSGHAQRLESAKFLANWLTKEAPKVDSDAMIMGDWNAGPEDSCWKPLHQIEDAGQAAFRSINDPSDFSYMWLRNKTDQFLSRIDLAAVSLSSMTQVAGAAGQVIRWKPIQEVLAISGNLTDKETVRVMKEIKEAVSDHLPVVTRFYFTKKQPQ